MDTPKRLLKTHARGLVGGWAANLKASAAVKHVITDNGGVFTFLKRKRERQNGGS